MNRFAPPKAVVADVGSQKSRSPVTWPVLVIVALYAMVAGAFAPTFFALVSTGIYSVLHFLLVALASLLLLLGAMLLAFRRHNATPIFGVAAVLASLSLLQQHPSFAYLCAGVSWVSAFASWWRFGKAEAASRKEPFLGET